MCVAVIPAGQDTILLSLFHLNWISEKCETLVFKRFAGQQLQSMIKESETVWALTEKKSSIAELMDTEHLVKKTCELHHLWDVTHHLSDRVQEEHRDSDGHSDVCVDTRTDTWNFKSVCWCPHRDVGPCSYREIKYFTASWWISNQGDDEDLMKTPAGVNTGKITSINH